MLNAYKLERENGASNTRLWPAPVASSPVSSPPAAPLRPLQAGRAGGALPPGYAPAARCLPLGCGAESTASIVGNIAAPASWTGLLASGTCLAKEMCVINFL